MKYLPAKKVSINRNRYSYLMLFSIFLIGNTSNGAEWQNIKSDIPLPVKVSLLSSDVKTSVVQCTTAGFYFETVTTADGKQNLLQVPEGIPLYEKGAPDLRRASASIIIPNQGSMELKVIYSSYKEYENIEIAPSKGIILIGDDAGKIPYEYGPVYREDAFYPGDLAQLREAHVMRNIRGQVIDLYPFQYNPVKKILRVYDDLRVEVRVNENEPGLNCLTGSLEAVPTETFRHIYEHNYLNYATYVAGNPMSTASRMPGNPNGRMLIVCYADFKSAIQPFVDWKIRKGIETEVVDAASIGKADAIKTYVDNYYKAHPDFTYLVLVGDHEQVPSNILTDPKGNVKYASDAKYAQITGSDKYPEIICGRISAETQKDVQVQVSKFLMYEKNPNSMTVDRFDNGLVCSVKIGPDNSQVYPIMRELKNILIKGGYEGCKELYEANLGDALPTAANISKEINSGIGFMSWLSHGSPTALISFNYNTSHLNQLSNTGMWPMIWNCSCQTGVFQKSGNPCFAETWLRANQGGRPTGAIGVAMSTRDMPVGPSEQYGGVAAGLLTDKTRANKTYGGLTYDTYIKTAIEKYKMAIEFDCMIIFGDPSLVVRTKAPMVLTASHNKIELPGVSNLVVNSNVEGAYVALTVKNKIIGTGTVNGGKVDIKFNSAITSTSDTIFVTATAFDYAPYMDKVLIQPTTAVHETADENFFTVFPNPSQGNFKVSFNITKQDVYTLELRNTLGQLIYQETLPDPFKGTYVKELGVEDQGMYMISLKNNSGTEWFKKVLVY